MFTTLYESPSTSNNTYLSGIFVIQPSASFTNAKIKEVFIKDIMLLASETPRVWNEIPGKQRGCVALTTTSKEIFGPVSIAARQKY